jgi:hypothetical protein
VFRTSMTIIEPSMVMSDHHTLERRGNEQTTQQAHRWRNKKERKKATTTTNLKKTLLIELTARLHNALKSSLKPTSLTHTEHHCIQRLQQRTDR